MSVIFLFPSGFVPPVSNQPGSVAGLSIARVTNDYTLADDGTIPPAAVIANVTVYASVGSFSPGSVEAGIRPRYVHSAVAWAGTGLPVPPTSGVVEDRNDYTQVPLTDVLTLNPLTGLAWTRANLFSDTWGWWAVWVNTGSAVIQATQALQVSQFFVRVEYSVAVAPAPVVGLIHIAGLTVSPPTWTFRVDGEFFDPGASVVLTDPSGIAFLLNGARIVSVVPTRVQFLTTADQIGLSGSYTVAVLNSDGQLSNAFAFTMVGPGVIVVTPPVGIHCYGYAYLRPPTPNTTNAPLDLAPGASISVFESGTVTTAAIFSDADLTLPLANPFLADSDAFFSFYTAPEIVSGFDHKVDIQFAGGGILVPYTIGDAICYDPRIVPLEDAVAILQAALTNDVATINAAIQAQQRIPLAFPLGGSLSEGVKNATRVDVVDPITVTLNGSILGAYVATVRVTVKTESAGTSVQAVLRNVTTAADVGSSTASVATANTQLSFTVTLTAGVNQYRLQIQPQNGNAFLYEDGYLELAVP